MRALTIVANDGTRLNFPAPKGVNVYLCTRALRAMNRGDDYLGLTAAESEFVADVVAQVEAHNEAASKPADES